MSVCLQKVCFLNIQSKMFFGPSSGCPLLYEIWYLKFDLYFQEILSQHILQIGYQRTWKMFGLLSNTE